MNDRTRDITIIEGAKPRAIAEHIAGAIERALARGEKDNQGGAEDAPRVAICVPGGQTPFPIFEELKRCALDWSRIAIWPGDDRLVAESHPASNVGRIRAVFQGTRAQIVALEEGLRVPHFALCWLGMGADGHIASLFPSTDPKSDDPQKIRVITPDPLPPEAPFKRITLTIPALLDSDEVVFTLGSSPQKREIFEAAMRGEGDWPVARLLAAARQPITCFA